MMLFMFISPVSALNDGAYLVSRSTSYTNPLTGKTEDGGENIALGESMVGNIVESKLLVEQTNGKYYITVGLGLASNVSNVRFKVMTSSGSMSSVSATKTGSSSANGDTVNHYRLQVSFLELYISPIMYVNPMGRDVQFFIKPNISSAIAGTGVYNSQMIPQNTETSTSQNTQSNTSKPTTNQTTQEETTKETQTSETTEIQQATVGTITKESLMENATGLSNHLINSKGKVDKKLKLFSENFMKFDAALRQDYTKVEIPVMLSQVLWAISVPFQTAILGHLSSDAIAANSVATTFYQYLKVIVVAMSSSSAVMIGSAVGRGDMKRIKSDARTLAVIDVLIGAALGLALFLLRKPLLTLYNLNDSALVMADQLIIVMSFIMVGMSYQMPTNGGIIRGSGSIAYSMKVDLISTWGIVIPLSMFMAFVVKASPAVVVCCLNADQIFKCVPAFLKCNYGHWIKNMTN